ncbi:MAG: zf-HC2 domain-containing protein [Lachnospiraceae bacterium]|nr:zf-HC2 domain-containing protein [Lachnospiraceae bacterium]
MTCKEAEKLIPVFLEDDLDTDDLREFMEHIDECGECKEELSIQFLVKEGLSRLEAGSVFDLKNELDYRIELEEHALKMRESLMWLSYLLDGLVVIAAIVLVALVMTFY